MHCPSHKNRILLNHGKLWGSMSVVFIFLPEVITFHDTNISQTFILEDTMTTEANDVNDHVLGCLRNIALRDFLIGTYFEVLDFV